MGAQHKEKVILFTTAIVLVVVFISSWISPWASSTFSGGECERCHSGFKAFTVTPDTPVEVPGDYIFEYKVVVKNTWKHDVKNLVATIDLTNCPELEFEEEIVPSPYHLIINDSVMIASMNEHGFYVDEGAVKVSIVLDGDEGAIGLNNIDLIVKGAEGGEWTSTGRGADEQINIEAEDLEEQGGVGEYTAIVDYVWGRREIPYTLIINVEYSPEVKINTKSGPDLEPGESHTFVWKLHSKSGAGNNVVKVSVTGTAYYDHPDPSIPDSDTYTYTVRSEIKVGTKYVYKPPPIEQISAVIALWLTGRILGFVAAGILILSIVFGGISKTVTNRLNKLFGGDAKRRIRWHCTISCMVMVIAIVHALILYCSLYAGTMMKGLLTGGLTLGIMCIIGITGVFQQRISSRIGAKNWRRLHCWLTILLLIVAGLHIGLEGTSFAFLRE